MSDRGSLFIQHLKQEAVIVKDDESFLRSLISGYNPNANYEENIRDSLNLLAELSSVSGYWPLMCAADIAYVSIRNVAISLLAREQTYVFDYNDLLDRFGEQQKISPRSLRAMRQLRSLKHSYRNRLTPTMSRDDLQFALVGANELFSGGASGQKCKTQINSWYHELRLLELQMVDRRDPRELDALPAHDPAAKIWNRICNPRGYPDKPN